MAAGLATLMLICALVLHNDCKLWKVIQRLLSLGGELLNSTRGNLELGRARTGGVELLQGIVADAHFGAGSEPFWQRFLRVIRNSTKLIAALLFFSLYAFLFLLFSFLHFLFKFCVLFFASFCAFCSFRRRFLGFFVVHFLYATLNLLNACFALCCGLTLQLCHSINTL